MAPALIKVPVRPSVCDRYELVPTENRMSVEDTWLVFASRKPMVGHVSWVDYIHRLYYGAVALNTVDARDYIQRNTEQDGWVVADVSRPTHWQTDGVHVYEKEPAYAA
jgi:hypothetical protein